MHIRSSIQILAITAMLAGTAQAGPALSCHWEAVPGTAFGAIGALRDQAMAADDSKAAGTRARTQLVELRAAIRPDDPLSLLRAGFWATTMHDIGVAPDTDGPALIVRALALRPNEADYQLFAALAYLHTDRAAFLQHWNRAQELAKPGSAAAINIKIVAKLYSELID